MSREGKNPAMGGGIPSGTDREAQRHAEGKFGREGAEIPGREEDGGAANSGTRDTQTPSLPTSLDPGSTCSFLSPLPLTAALLTTRSPKGSSPQMFPTPLPLFLAPKSLGSCQTNVSSSLLWLAPPCPVAWPPSLYSILHQPFQLLEFHFFQPPPQLPTSASPPQPCLPAPPLSPRPQTFPSLVLPSPNCLFWLFLGQG